MGSVIISQSTKGFSFVINNLYQLSLSSVRLCTLPTGPTG
jgi:type IV secretory pathway TraG/TraD family ATPase VirD4